MKSARSLARAPALLAVLGALLAPAGAMRGEHGQLHEGRLASAEVSPEGTPLGGMVAAASSRLRLDRWMTRSKAEAQGGKKAGVEATDVEELRVTVQHKREHLKLLQRHAEEAKHKETLSHMRTLVLVLFLLLVTAGISQVWTSQVLSTKKQASGMLDDQAKAAALQKKLATLKKETEETSDKVASLRAEAKEQVISLANVRRGLKDVTSQKQLLSRLTEHKRSRLDGVSGVWWRRLHNTVTANLFPAPAEDAEDADGASTPHSRRWSRVRQALWVVGVLLALAVGLSAFSTAGSYFMKHYHVRFRKPYDVSRHYMELALRQATMSLGTGVTD